MAASLTIVADAHIWGAKSAFAELPGFDVELRLLESRAINRDVLLDADILLTRSATRVDAALLSGTPIRFAATATIGDDHYDKAWLDRQGIAHASAAGSSTESVVEYMATALLHLHAIGRIDIPATTIGVIGVGRIGSRLVEFCERWGMRVLRNDPPRAREEGHHGFATLNTLLAEADLISLHTPLIRDGEEPTFHLLNEEHLQRFQGHGIINAARGACVDNSALIRWLDGADERFAVLDCWEHEPDIARVLLAHPGCLLPTPHIAGHSLDGKAANTWYAYNALCKFLDITPTWTPGLTGEAPIPVELDIVGDDWQQLHRIAERLYPIGRDTEAMRSWLDLSAAELPQAFTAYRRHYPERRGWPAYALHMGEVTDGLREKAAAVGIHIL